MSTPTPTLLHGSVPCTPEDTPTDPPILPSEQESENYFGGGRVLARTNISKEPWDPNQGRMVMRAIGQIDCPDIIEKWNSGAEHGVKDVLEKSGKCWNALYLIRLGPEDGEKYDPVVMVGVKPNSTSQIDANDLAIAVSNRLAIQGISSSDAAVIVHEATFWGPGAYTG